jgi:hypothetical protein
VKIECEDAGTFLDWSVDGKTTYGSCLRIQLASRPGMSFQVSALPSRYQHFLPGITTSFQVSALPSRYQHFLPGISTSFQVSPLPSRYQHYTEKCYYYI